MKTDILTLNPSRNVTLTAYIQGVEGEFPNIPRRPAILVLPGGGYQFCSEREADPVAMPYLKAGYQVFILRYSVGADAVWPNPLTDYEQAIETIRAKADEWYVYTDKIAVIGFSAGGHLAGAAATLSQYPPAAAILGYPAVLGETIHMCLPSAPDIPTAVNRHTVPCFIFTTRDDNVVPVRNVTAMADALDRHGISFECHIYAYGPHGFSTGDSSVLTPGTHICDRAGHWVADSLLWLKDMLGDFGQGQMTTPRCAGRINDDGGAFLSIDCTLGYLMQQEAAKPILAPLLQEALARRSGQEQGQEQTQGQEQEQTQEQPQEPAHIQEPAQIDMLGFAQKMKLRDILLHTHMPPETANTLDAQLRAIPSGDDNRR